MILLIMYSLVYSHHIYELIDVFQMFLSRKIIIHGYLWIFIKHLSQNIVLIIV